MSEQGLRRRTAGLALALASAAFLTAAAPAPAAWEEPVGGASPVNAAPNRDVLPRSDLAVVDGVPHVTWAEIDEVNAELRVARLDAAAGDWVELGQQPSPVNADPIQNAVAPSLADVGGVPHVAWTENDGVNSELRVARFDAAAGDWVELGQQPSPVNADPARNANGSSLADVGGVPHVAWTENDGVNSELRVARFDAAAGDWVELGAPGASPVNAAANRDASSPSLVDVGGVPYVAWREFDGSNDEVRVARLVAGDWDELGAPAASPVNLSPTGSAAGLSLADVDGIPHVAWSEHDGVNFESRVARFDAATDDWVELGGGASPVNASPVQDVVALELASVAGVPHVIWDEPDDLNDEVRVARFDATAEGWVELVGGASPVNVAPGAPAAAGSIADAGGVPYVTWAEGDGTNVEVRVKRLEPEFLDHAAVAGESGATLLTKVRTYGLAYPVAFQFGIGGFGGRTATAVTAGGQQEDTVFRTLGGLAPATTYSWRAIGFDGRGATGVGPGQAFTTSARAAAGSAAPPPTGDSAPAAAPAQAATTLLVAVLDDRLRAARGRRVRVRYLVTAQASLALEVLRGRRVVARVRERADAGRDEISWNGKVRGRPAPAGRYTLRVAARGDDGQSDSDQVALTVVRRPR